MAGRQCRHRGAGRCGNRSFPFPAERHAGNARYGWSSPALQLSEKSPVNDRRQRCQTVSVLADSPLRAALRTRGLRLALKSPELQQALVKKVPAKRLNQNCRSQVLLVFDGTAVDEVARTTSDPVAPFRMT